MKRKTQVHFEGTDVIYVAYQGTRFRYKQEQFPELYPSLKNRVLMDYDIVLKDMKLEKKKEKLLLWRKIIEELTYEDFAAIHPSYMYTPFQAGISALSNEQLIEVHKELIKRHENQTQR